MNKRILVLSFAFLSLIAIIISDISRLNDGKLHLIFCDVGQGDAIFIKTPNGNDILIDGGPDDSVLNCLSNHMPFWDKTIEVMVLTHPHADHLTGLISVLKRYEVIHYFTENVKNETLINKRLQDILAEKKTTAKLTYLGDRIDFSDKTSLLTIWPDKTWSDNHKLQDNQDLTNDNISLDVNGFSVIQKISYGNFNALLTGDAGVLIEDRIAKLVGEIDILKVPHHGSKTGMSDYFLSQTNPSLAVISVGVKNRYGHPSQIMLDLLNKRNIKTLRTDLNGEIEIISDGKTFNIYAN